VTNDGRTMDLAAAFALLTPRAIRWAEQRACEIAASGEPLAADEIALARSVGVADPERIRVSLLVRLPLPDDRMLRNAALSAGLLGPDMLGLTLGHGIYIRRGYKSARLLSHECRHVRQYEQAGSIAAYLSEYLRQVVQSGYWDAPYEIDARAHEREG